MNYQARQKKLLAWLDANHLDALLVTHLPNVRYLCGFTGSSGALLLSAQGSLFFSDGRYRSQAAAEVEKAKIAIRPTGRKIASIWAGGRAQDSL
jgi:Xaa-Pro aminopeptidase